MAKGRKTGGGSRKGVPNKKNAALIQAVESGGITPLTYMLSVMRDAQAEAARRDDMAKASAPYVHSRLTAVEHSGPGGAPISFERVERFLLDAAP